MIQNKENVIIFRGAWIPVLHRAQVKDRFKMARKISNYENFAHLSGDHNRKRYTVERTESSVSNASSKIEHGGQFVEVFLSVLKWLTAVLVFSVVVFCVAASKICLLVLGQQFKTFNQTRTGVLKETSVETRKQASILMLVLVLMIPQVASLVYATWTNLRRKSRPWPTKQGFILVSSNYFCALLFDRMHRFYLLVRLKCVELWISFPRMNCLLFAVLFEILKYS